MCTDSLTFCTTELIHSIHKALVKVTLGPVPLFCVSAPVFPDGSKGIRVLHGHRICPTVGCVFCPSAPVSPDGSRGIRVLHVHGIHPNVGRVSSDVLGSRVIRVLHISAAALFRELRLPALNKKARRHEESTKETCNGREQKLWNISKHRCWHSWKKKASP